jgi:hypothetical protein
LLHICRASNAQSLHGLRGPSPLCTQKKKGGPKPRAKAVAASSGLSGTSASQGSDGVRDGGDVNVVGGAPTPRIGLARATVDHLAQSREAAAGAVLGGSAIRQQHASGELGHASVDLTQSAPGVVVSCHRVDTMGGELFNWVRFSYFDQLANTGWLHAWHNAACLHYQKSTPTALGILRFFDKASNIASILQVCCAVLRAEDTRLCKVDLFSRCCEQSLLCMSSHWKHTISL